MTRRSRGAKRASLFTMLVFGVEVRLARGLAALQRVIDQGGGKLLCRGRLGGGQAVFGIDHFVSGGDVFGQQLDAQIALGREAGHGTIIGRISGPRKDHGYPGGY